MKLTVLSRYSRLGASSRLRTMQYLPYLVEAGFSIESAPFFPDDYLLRLYDHNRTLVVALRAYLEQLKRFRAIRSADLLWVEKEALPWVPWALERRLLPWQMPCVTDYDDAVFHRYDMHRTRMVRRLLGSKIDHVMSASALVTAGNSYLADRALAAGARQVEIIPTVVDVGHYSVRPSNGSSVPRIGWIGSPSTWTEYMALMMPLLIEVAASAGGRIMAVGAGKAAAAHPLLDVLPWSEDTEVARIQEMDLGVMPLADDPWARGKCGYKLIQCMACGLPVVASPVGVNAEIVEHGVNGFLATTEAEWREALTTLLREPELRQRMGKAGRRKVEQQYSLQVWGPRVAQMLRNVAEGQPA
ncbi:glycosyltransferase family 4 protein [Cereibacter sphaeroides]|uniref:glycosyltransferase family 4 protein n=1 Tax=Cereibacter sphaeroides TaxID=1063 RepID=UPI001F191AA8|nr:glycosyltransferase family 4 protein [Cereibacter sphaeroides]MCE6949625.1 glycosyltransferase family 4 protein [Cereibacter sphaeroides]